MAALSESLNFSKMTLIDFEFSFDEGTKCSVCNTSNWQNHTNNDMHPWKADNDEDYAHRICLASLIKLNIETMNDGQINRDCVKSSTLRRLTYFKAVNAIYADDIEFLALVAKVNDTGGRLLGQWVNLKLSYENKETLKAHIESQASTTRLVKEVEERTTSSSGRPLKKPSKYF